MLHGLRIALIASSMALLSFIAPAPLVAAPQGTAAQLIARLRMQKIPDEGAWFAGSYRSAEPLPAQALDARYRGTPHVAGSAIYALVTQEDFSALHRLQTDEIWHYYGGSPLAVLLLHPDGRGETIVLGADVLAGQTPQLVVPRGVWQGASPVDSNSDAYTLFGCTLAPSFEYGDFQIGYRDDLQAQYPAFANRIAQLTRKEFAKQPAGAKRHDPAVDSATSQSTSQSTLFGATEIEAIDAAPGIQLREFVGREARFRTAKYSIAQFTLAPGTGMPTSHNKSAEEAFLVIAGRGTLTLDGKAAPVGAGSTVIIAPQVRHSIRADADAALTFYAISIPAFSADDYVVAPAK